MSAARDRKVQNCRNGNVITCTLAFTSPFNVGMGAKDNEPRDEAHPKRKTFPNYSVDNSFENPEATPP